MYLIWVSRWLVGLVLAFGVVNAQAQGFKKLYKIPVEAKGAVKLSFIKAHLVVKGTKSKDSVQIETNMIEVPKEFAKDADAFYSEWPLQVAKVGTDIQIQNSGPSVGSLWRESLRQNSWPTWQVIVYLPEGWGFEGALKEGQASLSQLLNNKVSMKMANGSVSIQAVQGEQSYFISRGKLDIEQAQGSIEVNSFLGDVTILKSKAEVRLENFGGKTLLAQTEGDMSLVVKRSDLEVTGHKGKVDIQSDQKKVVIRQLEGTLKADSQLGDIDAEIIGEADVRVKADRSNVTIKHKSSGASLNIGSKEGQLTTARYLKLTRYPSIKVIRGRLRGDSKGRIFVRTKTGNVVVR